jgi:hypothetical protein
MTHEPVALGRDALVVLVVEGKSEAQPRQQVIGLGRAVGLERQALERRNQRQRRLIRRDAGRQPAAGERLGGNVAGKKRQKSDADGANHLDSLQ